MKPFYRYLFALAALATFTWSQQAAAQEFTECPDDQDECIVEWDTDGDFLPNVNALRNTIANDVGEDGSSNIRPEGRYYVLRRGGLYYIEDTIVNDGFDLRLFGQTPDEARPEDNVCGTSGAEDCGPAVIQRFRREDNTVAGQMIQSNGDGTGGQDLRNVWIQGQDNSGVTANYEPIVINSSNSYFNYDNVIFDRNDWHHLGFKAGGNEIYIRNSTFRNLVGPTQRYEGRGIRLEAGADVLVMENNTLFNITSFPVQSETAPIDYFLFNHNTLVNFGLAFNAGGIWQQAFVANNLLVNPFFQGESEDLYTNPDRVDPFSGVFGISVLPSRFGLEIDRRIVLANNAYWRDPAIESFYQTFDPVVRAQPLVNDSTMSFFDIYDGMVIQGNINANPMLANAPIGGEVYDSLFAFIEGVSVDMDGVYPYVVWDPGRDENPLAINFPFPEDFTYSNTALQTYGTDGLPVGDLNWYPDAKADYLANREEYVQDVVEIAGSGPEETIGEPSVEAETGVLSGGAEVQTVAGITDIDLQNGNVTWTFELAEETTIGLSTLVSLNDSDNARGTRIFIDGTQINTQSLYGETMFCRTDFLAYDDPPTTCSDLTGGFPLEAGTFGQVDFTAANVIVVDGQNPAGPDALTLAAGEHTVRIQVGWGGNFYIRQFDILDANGNVIEELTPPEAETEGVDLICDDGAFCPQGFQYVALGAGSSVAVMADLPAGTRSALPRIFYQSATGGDATLSVNGSAVADFSFPASAAPDEVSEVIASRFNVDSGTQTVTLTVNSGELELDYVIFNAYETTTTGIEDNELPDGYALKQNYPNPFNPVTTIQYELGAVGHINITVYDVLGRKVTTLLDGMQVAGPHQIAFDGSSLASGVYFYRLQTSVGQQVRRMVLLK